MILKETIRWIYKIFSHILAYSTAAIISFYLFFNVIYEWWKYPSENSKHKRRELPPACLNDKCYGEHSYVQIKNIKLHYVENGDRTKPLLLLLHGFPEFWFSWRHQLKYFSKNYWVVAVDMRGFGDSEKPSGVDQYKIKYLVNDVKNLINALGKNKCILIGHDWGSIIGWYFVLKYPDMVDKYVMIGRCQLFSKIGNWRHFIKSWYMNTFLLPYFPEWYIRWSDFKIFDRIFRNSSEEEKEAYKFIFGKPGAITYPINYYRANAFKFALPLKKTAKDVQLPQGLMIHTESETKLDSNIKDIKQIVENLDIISIKSEARFIHQSKYIEVNNIIATFLGSDLISDPGNAKSVQFND